MIFLSYCVYITLCLHRAFSRARQRKELDSKAQLPLKGNARLEVVAEAYLLADKASAIVVID